MKEIAGEGKLDPEEEDGATGILQRESIFPHLRPQKPTFLSYPTIIKQYPQFTSAAHKRDSYCIIGGKINISTD